MKHLNTPLRKFVALVASFIISYYGFTLIFSQTIALLIMISIGLHELGHFMTFRLFGYPSKMIFIPFLGAFVAPDNEEAMKKMRRSEEAAVALAGPMVNILLLACGLIAALALPTHHDIAMTLASLNAYLAAVNLLPFFILDGGRLAYALYSSADEKRDRLIANSLSCVGLLALIVLFGLNRLTFTVPLFIWGIQRASEKDDPEAWREPRSMKWPVVTRYASIYGVVMFIALVCNGVLKHWLEY